ncbi:hypothetical protein [Candidatus Albibeggiatoa sp. nov. NOAA]|uniref:hypothetical protein n=1 Tax=Candidatus Albibeggiatoa sp. nov. NOAA TaxID=3162724 RepID=UPI0032FC376B|nr:hypothetical protein [Thiotrichaceae bacterium]
MKQWMVCSSNVINMIFSTTAFAVGLLALLNYGSPPLLLTLFLFLVLLSIGLQIYTNFLTQYGHKNSQEYIHEAVHTIRNAYYYLKLCKSNDYPNVKFEELYFKKYLTSSLTAASIAFYLTTGKNCRTCIKIISSAGTESDKYQFETLARDINSSKQCQQADTNLSHKPITLKDDPTFYQIISGQKNFYFSNNLSKSDEANYFKNLSHYSKKDALNKNWPLPYIATILSPIRYSSFRDEYSNFTDIFEEEREQRRYYGFFAVDSKSKNTFSESEHQMAATIADALVPLLDLYSTIDSSYKDY